MPIKYQLGSKPCQLATGLHVAGVGLCHWQCLQHHDVALPVQYSGTVAHNTSTCSLNF